MKLQTRHRVALLVWLLMLGWIVTVARPSDTTYHVKVMSVDHGKQRLEAKFLVVPEDLRLVCHGEAKKVDVGDYAKVEVKDGRFVIAGAVCTEVAWLK